MGRSPLHQTGPDGDRKYCVMAGAPAETPSGRLPGVPTDLYDLVDERYFQTLQRSSCTTR